MLKGFYIGIHLILDIGLEMSHDFLISDLFCGSFRINKEIIIRVTLSNFIVHRIREFITISHIRYRYIDKTDV